MFHGKHDRETRLFEESLDRVRPIALIAVRSLEPWVEVDDLVQAGRIGLWNAARRYDGSDGTFWPFFGYFKVKYAIRDYLRSEHFSRSESSRHPPQRPDLLAGCAIPAPEPAFRWRELHDECSRLPPEQQRAIHRHYWLREPALSQRQYDQRYAAERTLRRRLPRSLWVT